MVKTLLKHTSVPALIISGCLISWLAIRFQWNYELAAFCIFLSSSVGVLFLEQIIPLKPQWKTKSEDILIDLKYLLSTAFFDALGKAFAIWLMLYVYRLYVPNNERWEGMPFILVYVLANIIGEFLPYVYHRISHVGKTNSVISLFLWKVHAIHHLPVSLNWFKTSWMHPINMFVNTFLKYGVLFLFGFDEVIIFTVGVTHILIAYMSHANIETKTGILDYVIVTPKIHQFHHSKKLEEAKNFGNIIPFWDIVFNSFYNRKGNVENVGVTEASYTYPDQSTILKQWAFPLNTRRNCCLSNK